MSNLDDIVDRAIDYTHLILRSMPTYHDAAVEGLRKLRDALAAKTPGDPAIAKLDSYLVSLRGAAPHTTR